MQQSLSMLQQEEASAGMPGTDFETTPLNVLDELYLHLDREDEPWSVHLEMRVEGRIDDARLGDAVREAALRHPIARARLVESRVTDIRYHWEIADALEGVDLETVEGADLPAARERLLSRTPALERPGPFALLLAHHPDGDSVAINLHHAAGDGLSALRLMGSIARAYAGEEDPLAPVDALGVRDVGAMAGAGSIKERLARGRATLDYLARGVTTPVRIEPQGHGDRPGYGFELLALQPDELGVLLERRPDGATVNDALLGGLAVAVRRWNAERDGDEGSVYLMMPINLRPPGWRFDVVGNFASYVSVRLGAREQDTLEAATAAAAEGTRRVKDGAVAGLIIDLFSLPTVLPTGLKRRMQDLIPLTGNVVVDTAVLSNLGRVQDVPHLGEAGAVRELWFSPPGRMPLGASLGAVTLGERLFLTLRYRHALFDQAAAAGFMATFREVLAGTTRT
jgi:NRPS condensation-like uncharacterized protein